MLNANLGYGRVSTKDQANDSNALTQQVNRLVRSGVDELFVDVQSGEDDDRPELEKVLDRVRSGTCRRVTVTRDDRIARHGVMSLQLLDLFEKSGVELCILDGGGVSDLSNPYHWKQRAQAGIDAEFENRVKSMSIRRGFEEFRREGKANPKPPWGYVRQDERYQPAPEWEAARGSVDLFLELQTLQAVIRTIDERYNKQWSANGFRRWLLNPVLRGHTGYGLDKNSSRPHQQLVYNTHQAMITEAEFEEICSILKENKRFWGANKQAPRYPLGGLVFCGECGTKCAIARGSKYLYLWCRQRKQKLLSKPCSQRKTPRYDDIEGSIINALLARAEAIANIAATPEQEIEPPELQALKAELAYYQGAPGDRAAGIVAELNNQILALKQQGLQATAGQKQNQELLMACFSDSMYWKTLSDEEKRDIYRALVSRVVIREGKVERVELKV